ncbi:plasmid replication, integration and excision activator [Sphaerisporangium album]|uniref:Plasmid replication, integration and excision activator n=1 Tax=Sphaerisporangium album TaxID=509200 RepID=A0A367FHA1_9ACTN|nr:plasmid replication, integration and excision activator [Sphaerisporangium album]RCG29087.1 plasmid replication, integration and excision activator [Sphaerisporangium album]
MAIPRAFKVEFGEMFPLGCYMVGEVDQVKDFEASTPAKPVWARDKDTGDFVWQVTVLDCDPEARDKTLKVKVSSPVQPVPPAPMPGLPFIPVEFDGLTVTPWQNGQRIAYSVRAREMRAPRTTAAPVRTPAASKQDAA